MTRYKVEGPYNSGDLESLFPQNPDSVNGSLEALFNDRFDDGWELVSAVDSSGNWRLIFKANGRNS